MATKKITTEKKSEKSNDAVVAKIIMAPRITEKASMQSSANAYTFVVAKNATKHTVLAEYHIFYDQNSIIKIRLIKPKIYYLKDNLNLIVFHPKEYLLKLCVCL